MAEKGDYDPTKFTPARQEVYLRALEMGLTRRAAAAAAGVHIDTVGRMRKRRPKKFGEAEVQAELAQVTDAKREAYFDALRIGLRPRLAAETANLRWDVVRRLQETDREWLEEELEAERRANDRMENALFETGIKGSVRAQETWLFNRVPERWQNRRTGSSINIEEPSGGGGAGGDHAPGDITITFRRRGGDGSDDGEAEAEPAFTTKGNGKANGHANGNGHAPEQ